LLDVIHTLTGDLNSLDLSKASGPLHSDPRKPSVKMGMSTKYIKTIKAEGPPCSQALEVLREGDRDILYSPCQGKT